MPYDEALATRLRHALSGVAGVSERSMFGGLCFLLDGNMLCGVEKTRYMFRVGKEKEAAALARPGAAPMDFTGRPLGGMVWVDAAECRGWRLAGWLSLARAFVGKLPKK
ncbi:MAG: TfoX/Sxy family protein [Alphaproteobacteria bacterium]|nr:TfoX/Sxy family protein [Alphaproteobacteria bacterium]